MKPCPLSILATVLLSSVFSLLAADAPPAATLPVSLALFAPGASEASVAALSKALTEGSVKVTCYRAATAQEAIVSRADILVLMATRADHEALLSIPVEGLKGRKILGIGYGAAQFFDGLGLAIRGGNCAHGTGGVPRLLIRDEALLQRGSIEKTFNFFEPPILDAKNFHNDLVFGVYIGEKKPEIRAAIEVLATFANNDNYAPVARQGSAILVCVEGRAESWSTPFRSLIRVLATELRTTPAAAK